MDPSEVGELATYVVEELAVVRFIKEFVASRDPLECTTVDDRRRNILEDLAHTVFCGKTDGNPPVRGELGEAEIILLPNAKPVKQRAFSITGERRAAWGRLVDQLVRDGKIEPGIGPWCSPSFPVPKRLPGP